MINIVNFLCAVLHFFFMKSLDLVFVFSTCSMFHLPWLHFHDHSHMWLTDTLLDRVALEMPLLTHSGTRL